MTGQERDPFTERAELRERVAAAYEGEVPRLGLDEVERLRADLRNTHENVMRLQDKLGFSIDRETQARADVERLRDRLAELEWACSISSPQFGCCPACHHGSDEGHAAGCWLAAELRGGR